MQAEYQLLFRPKNVWRPECGTTGVGLIVNHLLFFDVFANSAHNNCGQLYLEPL